MVLVFAQEYIQHVYNILYIYYLENVRVQEIISQLSWAHATIVATI